MMDLYTALGYLTGLYFIKPEMDVVTLLRTTAIIHLLDALLCYLIAIHNGRSRTLWSFLGLILGIWALGPLFLIVDKKQPTQKGIE
ncbi:MAG: hypothetical protein QF619_06700 [Candidatus Binatia bacterium]|jgi:hypothetical protein|nr:hypothetical protein [Candidatus Binatia bacterium]